MIGILQQILCWIKLIGAMVLNSFIDGINLCIAGIVAFLQALIDAWPVETPDLPSMPSEFITALGWVAWSPLPVHQLVLFLLFSLGVWVLWLGIAIVLRWAKAID